jgi:hypothetical protein
MKNLNVSGVVLALSLIGAPLANAQAPQPAAPAAEPAPAEAAPAPAPPVPAPPAPGSAILPAIAGNSLRAAGGKGGSLVLYFQTNGTVKQLDDDATTAGKWALRGETLCMEFPDEDEDETCYSISVTGTSATLTDEDGSTRRYDILEGNANNL